MSRPYNIFQLSVEGSQIAVGGDGGVVRLFDSLTGQVSQTLRHVSDGPVQVVAAGRDASGLVIVTATSALDVPNSAEVWTEKKKPGVFVPEATTAPRRVPCLYIAIVVLLILHAIIVVEILIGEDRVAGIARVLYKPAGSAKSGTSPSITTVVTVTTSVHSAPTSWTQPDARGLLSATTTVATYYYDQVTAQLYPDY
ncbi:hypothetical protein FOMPIDRAFT_95137, partial [Fomitopsis schrenkii]